MWEKKDLNKLLGELTDLGFFVILFLSFFLWNLTLLFFLFYRIFKPSKYEKFIKSIQTDELFTFKKQLDTEPLMDDDDDWEPGDITEEFEEESLEVEEILKRLERKQLWGETTKSNINRYIYWWMESALLGYLLWFFSTVNWILSVNFIDNPEYVWFTTIILIWLFFFYNFIFEFIYWTKSQFVLWIKKKKRPITF